MGINLELSSQKNILSLVTTLNQHSYLGYFVSYNEEASASL